MKQRSELLTICAEAEIIQFSEMVRGALYTSHEMSRVFTGSLRVVCERTHRFRKITGSVNEPKSDDPGTNAGTHYPCIFRNLCVKGALQARSHLTLNPISPQLHERDTSPRLSWSHVWEIHRNNNQHSYSSSYVFIKPVLKLNRSNVKQNLGKNWADITESTMNWLLCSRIEFCLHHWNMFLFNTVKLLWNDL